MKILEIKTLIDLTAQLEELQSAIEDIEREIDIPEEEYKVLKPSLEGLYTALQVIQDLIEDLLEQQSGE